MKKKEGAAVLDEEKEAKNAKEGRDDEMKLSLEGEIATKWCKAQVGKGEEEIK